ncbi:hypothetical protein [Peribacillus sp. SCS-37]|uniref:hypothetical protein n=1 Tax=Paraperibacillus esterisolvens TaxID=3115296 RepID=UPI003905C3A5
MKIAVHVHDSLYEGGRIHTAELNPVGRLAGAAYTRPAASTFDLPRRQVES